MKKKEAKAENLNKLTMNQVAFGYTKEDISFFFGSHAEIWH